MALTQKFAKQMLPLFADGRLKPLFNRSFQLEDFAQAHRYKEDNSNFGKIVLRIS